MYSVTTTISDNQLSASVLLNHIHTMELTRSELDSLLCLPRLQFLTIQKCMKGEGWVNLQWRIQGGGGANAFEGLPSRVLSKSAQT